MSRELFIEVHRTEAAVGAAEASLALADAQIGFLSVRMAALQAIAVGLDAMRAPTVGPAERAPIDDVIRQRARRLLSRAGFVKVKR